MKTWQAVAVIVISGAAAGGLFHAASRTSPAIDPPRFEAAASTSRVDLARTAEAARVRLSESPGDGLAGVALADVLLRLARVESDAGHALEAERALDAVLEREPGDYTALKMLGAVYLSQHRFRDAIAAAERALAVRPQDAWNYGVVGDARLELGDYEEAFDAFDRMVRLRPDAAAYARVAYAQEIQGRLEEALLTMRRAAEATSAHDPESQAWHYAQLGNLHLELGQLDAAAREYARADFTFPGHPYARLGRARVATARSDHGGALRIYQALFDEGATPELAAAIGDVLAATGDETGAQAMYSRAESLEREGWASEEPQPAALAAMLAERGLKPGEAVRLAEQAAATRVDIHTMDALAFAYYRAGRIEDAAAASARALRTGTRNRRIREHAAIIARAAQGEVASRD